MAANESHSLTANPSKDAPSDCARDARESAHDDDSTDENNSVDASRGSPPNHGLPTHSTARFLWEVDKRTPVSELGELYDRWREGSEQVDISRWSE